jgi:hypothetical protein
VPGESGNFLHGGVFPKDDLIQRIAVSTHDFVHVFREHKVAHLGACVDIVYWLEGVSVPESNTSISCSTTRSKETILMWAPSNSFDSCCVIREFS